MVYRPKGDGSFSKPEMVYIPTDNGSLSKPETEIEEKSSTRKVVEEAVTVAGTVVAVAGMVAWGAKPETETEEKRSTRKVVEAAVTVVGTVVAVAGMVAWGVSLFSSEAESSDKGKLMKRPGENGYIKRAVFESDPKGYFKKHRQNKR